MIPKQSHWNKERKLSNFLWEIENFSNLPIRTSTVPKINDRMEKHKIHMLFVLTPILQGMFFFSLQKRTWNKNILKSHMLLNVLMPMGTPPIMGYTAVPHGTL